MQNRQTCLSAHARIILSLAICLVLLLGGFVLSVNLGAWQVGTLDIFKIITGRIFSLDFNFSLSTENIIWFGRVPRALTGILVGFSLGCAGTIMQGIFRNPLASPGIIGTSSGAALGAVIAIYLGLTSISIYITPAFSIFFAFLSLVLILTIASTGGITSRYTLLLAGIAFNALFNALTSFVIVLSTSQYEMARQVVGWLMGTLTNRTWNHVEIIFLVTVLGFLGAMIYARDLNILMIDEETAANLGVNVTRSRNALLLLAAILTGGSIAVSGVIGFVGLISPHIMRSFVGAENRFLIPAAGIFGGIMVTYADCIVKIWEGAGMRIGVLTAILGGPFFLFLVIRDKNKATYF